MKERMNTLIIGIVMASIFAASAYAEEPSWDADDVRGIIRDYFTANGRALPADARIGPEALDNLR